MVAKPNGATGILMMLRDAQDNAGHGERLSHVLRAASDPLLFSMNAAPCLIE
jgi:hypothetical protein